MEEQIVVPFSCKAKARENGAVFNKSDRCWYIPSRATEEQKQILRNLIIKNESTLEDSTESLDNNDCIILH